MYPLKKIRKTIYLCMKKSDSSYFSHTRPLRTRMSVCLALPCLTKAGNVCSRVCEQQKASSPCSFFVYDLVTHTQTYHIYYLSFSSYSANQKQNGPFVILCLALFSCVRDLTYYVWYMQRKNKLCHAVWKGNVVKDKV